MTYFKIIIATIVMLGSTSLISAAKNMTDARDAQLSAAVAAMNPKR